LFIVAVTTKRQMFRFLEVYFTHSLYVVLTAFFELKEAI
jgi:hypothetical protein